MLVVEQYADQTTIERQITHEHPRSTARAPTIHFKSHMLTVRPQLKVDVHKTRSLTNRPVERIDRVIDRRSRSIQLYIPNADEEVVQTRLSVVVAVD